MPHPDWLLHSYIKEISSSTRMQTHVHMFTYSTIFVSLSHWQTENNYRKYIRETLKKKFNESKGE